MWSLVFPNMGQERYEGVDAALSRMEVIAISKGWNRTLLHIDQARDDMERGQYKDTFCFYTPAGYFMVDTDDRWS